MQSTDYERPRRRYVDEAHRYAAGDFTDTERQLLAVLRDRMVWERSRQATQNDSSES
jgi:hypothetical protein